MSVDNAVKRGPGRPRAVRSEPVVPSAPRASDSTEEVTQSNMSTTEDFTAPVITPAPEVLEQAQSAVHVIHFVHDGLSGLGKIWLQGEELAIEEGTPLWADTLEQGRSWVTLDEDEQIAKWGVRYFRPGAWAGAGFDAAEFKEMYDKNGNLVGLTPQELAQLEALRRKSALASFNNGQQPRSGHLTVPAQKAAIDGIRTTAQPSRGGPPILPTSR